MNLSLSRNTAWSLAGWAATCLLFTGLAVTSLQNDSVTIDEFGHLPAGLNLLNSADFRYSNLNPPLVNIISALPLKLLGFHISCPPGFPEECRHEFWTQGYLFMDQYAPMYHAAFILARYGTVMLTLLLGLLAFLWGRALAPQHPALGGFLAAFLLLDPNLLAHARLVTTDAGVTLLIVASLFAMHTFLRKPSWGPAIACGIVLGLAQLTKFTAIYLYPVFLGFLLFHIWQQPSPRLRPILQALSILLLSIVVLNAGYLFHHSLQPTATLEFKSEIFQTWNRSPASHIPIPLPADFILAFDQQLADSQIGDPSYLFGHSYTGGRWYYFFALLTVKTPLPVFLLLGLALCTTIRRRGLPARDSLLLLSPALLILLAFSFLSNKQLGIRMILPATALLWIWIASTLASETWTSRSTRIALGILCLWLPLETIRIHPHYLAYFNPLAGGPEQGYLFARDSNLDWGQDLPALRRYMQKENLSEIQLLYFGRVDPSLYEIEYTVPLHGLQPGHLAVSRSLYGREAFLLYDHGRLVWAKIEQLPAGTAQKIASLNHTLDIYRILPTP